MGIGEGGNAGTLFTSAGRAVVGVRAIEKRPVFADKNDPSPEPQAERGFSGAGAPSGLVTGESRGREFVLVSENGRRFGVFRV